MVVPEGMKNTESVTSRGRDDLNLFVYEIFDLVDVLFRHELEALEHKLVSFLLENVFLFNKVSQKQNNTCKLR